MPLKLHILQLFKHYSELAPKLVKTSNQNITLIKSQPHILHFFDVVGCNKKMKILYKCVDYITYELSR